MHSCEVWTIPEAEVLEKSTNKMTCTVRLLTFTVLGMEEDRDCQAPVRGDSASPRAK